MFTLQFNQKFFSCKTKTFPLNYTNKYDDIILSFSNDVVSTIASHIEQAQFLLAITIVNQNDKRNIKATSLLLYDKARF